jgi:hypothetical protein
MDGTDHAHEAAEPTSTGSAAERWAGTLAAMTDLLVDDHDVAAYARRTVRGCVEVLDARVAAIVVLDAGGKPGLLVASDEDPLTEDVLRADAAWGSCARALASGEPVSSELDDERARRPELARAAKAARVRLGVAHPLLVQGRTHGALSVLFAGSPELLAWETGALRVMANLTAVCLAQPDAAERDAAAAHASAAALRARAVVAQAQGMLLAHGGLDAHEALRALRAYASVRDRPLDVVSREIVLDVVPISDVLQRLGPAAPDGPG